MLIDTHAHINFPQFASDSVAEIIKRAKENSIDYIINVGSDLDNSKESVKLAQDFDNIYASVGIHPHDAESASKDHSQIDEIKALLQKDKVVALGEIGLDYFKYYCPVEAQRITFEKLLNLAVELDKPVIIHNRDADNDIYEILKHFKPAKAVIHCFSSDIVYAKKILDLGYYISFTGNITFPKNITGQEVVKYVPLDRLMVETDCPFLAPEPFRGKRNEPAYVKYAAEKVAELKEISFAEVAKVTTENAKKFFGLNI